MKLNERIFALVPARSGSKRLPGKNIKYLHGRPMIEYSILAGLHSELISETYISSDSLEYGECGINLGAKFLKRPKKISSDFSSTSEVLVHFSESLGLQDDDIIVTLQPTNPFRPKDLITKVLKWSLDLPEDWESIITVDMMNAKFGTITNNEFQPINYLHGQRSQDLEKIYVQENGLLYVTKVSTLKIKGNMFGDNVVPYVIDSPYCHVDIDTNEDFIIANTLYPLYKTKYNLI